MFKGCIYRHWITINGKEISYIGLHKGVNPQKDRWGQDGKKYKPIKEHRQTKFWRAIQTYGWENFGHEIIGYVEAPTLKQLALDLDEWEIYYIAKYDSFYNGFNGTTGGQGGYIVSDDTRIKLSEARKGKYNGENNPFYGRSHSNETRKKLSQRLSGDGNPNYGKQKSDETKKKMSDSHKGKTFTDEHKKKLSEAKKGSQLTNEHKKKIGEALKGKPITEEHKRKISNSHKGKTLTDEHKKKLSEAKKGKNDAQKKQMKPIICLETGQVFKCIGDAKRWSGCSGIANHLCGKNKSAGKHPETGEKLHWMYYSDYIDKNN